MNDLLSTLQLPSRPLPVGGEVVAIAAGRRMLRRRRITAVVVSGGSAAAVVAAVLVVTGGASRGDSLSSVTPASRAAGSAAGKPARVVATPTELPGGVVPSPLPTPSGLPVGIGPQPSSSPAPPPSEQPAPAEAHGPYVGFEPTGADGGPAITRTMSNDPTFCERNAEVADYRHPDGWCTVLTTSAPPEGFVAGHRISFTLEMCKAPETGAATLHFPNRMEIDVAAHEMPDTGDEIQRWGWDNKFAFPAAPHSLTFNAGDCATWVVTWSGQGYDGYAVPEGAYDVVGSLTADEYLSDDADYPPPVASLRQGLTVSWAPSR